MRTSIIGLSAVSLLAFATPAFADDAAPAAAAPTPEWKVTGSAALVSDYRFRGISQNGQDFAAQAGITLNHSSGFYVGTWGSSINFAGHTEVDLFAGYTAPLSKTLTIDAGVLYYLYPKHKSVTGDIATDYFEPYINLTETVGPLAVKVGVNYGWKQDALALTTCDEESEACTTVDKDEIYFHIDPSVTIPMSPIGLNAHLGYAVSEAPFLLGKNHMLDYSFGATAAWKNLTLGVSYVGTDMDGSPRGYDGGVVFSLTAAF